MGLTKLESNHSFRKIDTSMRQNRQPCNALRQVRLEPDDFLEQSPFLLSGGEKRRIAIAGALALNPDVLLFIMTIHFIMSELFPKQTNNE